LTDCAKFKQAKIKQTVRKLTGFGVNRREERAAKEFGPFRPDWLPEVT
jgi:hypothetical protein